MDLTPSELFGHLVYADSFTYQELLATEEHLIEELDDLLVRAEAQHLEFNPSGDALLFQGEFTHYKLYIFRKLACELAQMLPDKISGRLLFLSHDLEQSAFYWVQSKAWQEHRVQYPMQAPANLKSWQG
ncbi:MAG: hypothetical protein IJU79_04150 [Desulfovibrionaceae bacterium]|nr:hypothetical protein [Desulfovibrionaceae bacterium]